MARLDPLKPAPPPAPTLLLPNPSGETGHDPLSVVLLIVIVCPLLITTLSARLGKTQRERHRLIHHLQTTNSS